MPNIDITLEAPVRFAAGYGGARRIRRDEAAPPPSTPVGRVPKIARQMALAIKLEALLHAGEVKSQEDIARIGRVTQAYVSRIMGLLNLAPDLQEALLFQPRVERGRPQVLLRDLNALAAEPDWAMQRALWKERGWPNNPSC